MSIGVMEPTTENKNRQIRSLKERNAEIINKVKNKSSVLVHSH